MPGMRLLMPKNNHPLPAASPPPSPLKGEGDILDKKSPLRKCVVTGESFDKSELLRFVRAPNGTLTFDANNKLQGRGAYVSCNADALAAALKKNLFAKSFKEQTKTPPDMAVQIIAQIRQAALQYLALARRAGDAVAGLEKCKDFASRYRIAAVIMAEGAGEDIRNTAKRIGDEPMPPITDFNRDELGGIFGRDQSVLVLIRTGGLGSKFLSTLQRYQALKTLEKPKEKA